MLVRSLLASALFLATVAAPPVYAETRQQPAPFRTAEAQTFTAAELETLGLTKDEAAKGVDLQARGYHLVALTPDEAKAYTAGNITQTEWIMIGIGVLIILAVA